MRIPVVTQEPISVTTDMPAEQYTVKRVTATCTASGTTAWIGPEPGYVWEIMSLQYELACDGNAGNRYMWAYYQDELGVAFRRFITEGTAGKHYWHISAPGAGVGSTAFTTYATLSSSPASWSIMRMPAKVGVQQSNFFTATDVCRLYAIVKEHKRV